MLGPGKTRAVRALVTAGSARSRDADIYRRYAVGLYRQALLTRGDPALAEPVACAVLVNEGALAAIPERGDDDARYRLTQSVLWRYRRAVSGAAARVARRLLRDEGRQCRGPLSRDPLKSRRK
jgi:hypothetical protein